MIELQPVHDSRKSFYGKARTQWVDDDTELQLISYGTHVASIHFLEGEKVAEVYGTYSATTLRHIKDFLYQNDFEIGNKAFIERIYMV